MTKLSKLIDVRLAVIGLATLTLLSCVAEQPQETKLTPEEAAYGHEVSHLVAAACAVGTTERIITGYQSVPCGVWEECSTNPWGGTKQEAVYADRHIVDLELLKKGASVDATTMNLLSESERVEALWAPSGLEDLRDRIRDVITVQLSVNKASETQKAYERARLATAARAVCVRHQQFNAAVASRPGTPVKGPSLTFSFQPIMTPLSFGINSEGQFSVSVSNSVETPIGRFSVAASVSTAATLPKRLIIRSKGHQRIFLLDRPFSVFVPTDYGVTLTNTGSDLIVDVAERAPAVASHVNARLVVGG